MFNKSHDLGWKCCYGEVKERNQNVYEGLPYGIGHLGQNIHLCSFLVFTPSCNPHPWDSILMNGLWHGGMSLLRLGHNTLWFQCHWCSLWLFSLACSGEVSAMFGAVGLWKELVTEALHPTTHTKLNLDNSHVHDVEIVFSPSGAWRWL